jgi:hypothetical protein
MAKEGRLAHTIGRPLPLKCFAEAPEIVWRATRSVTSCSTSVDNHRSGGAPTAPNIQQPGETHVSERPQNAKSAVCGIIRVRGGARLGVSTATLSQTIQATEDRLGLRLLDRTTLHVAPTPAGERLLQNLRPVLENLKSALEELDDGRDRPAGHLRLAIAPAASPERGPILARFAGHYPDVPLLQQRSNGLRRSGGEVFARRRACSNFPGANKCP